MTRVILLISLLFSINLMASADHMVCNYGDAHAVASYDSVGTLSQVKLDDFRAKIMMDAFDDAYNCNEGVELLGAVKTEAGADYLADCAIDSLGVFQVKLTLTCTSIKSLFK